MTIRQHLTDLGYCTVGREHTDIVDCLLAVDAQIAVEADKILAVDAHITVEPVLNVSVDPLNMNDATEEINFEEI